MFAENQHFLAKEIKKYRLNGLNGAPFQTGDKTSVKKEKQVTRGHNFLADRWAGASNPHPDPNSPIHIRTYAKVSKTLFHLRSWTKRPTDRQMNTRTKPVTHQRMDKSSYTDAYPQLKMKAPESL